MLHDGLFSQVMPPGSLTDEEAFPEPSGSQSDRKTSLSINTLDILSVNQLLDSVRQALFYNLQLILNYFQDALCCMLSGIEEQH